MSEKPTCTPGLTTGSVIRAVFTASQMTEMGQVAGKVRGLLADLEGNHRSLFGR